MMTSLITVLLLQAAPGAAPTCTAPVAPPAGLEAWSAPSASATETIEPGKATAVSLQPVGNLKFALPPERAPAAGTFAGVYPVAITAAGTYRIALQNGAWIDLVRDGKPVKSAGHMEGAACSGIRKIVDFVLEPGTYALQLSGAKAAQMRVLIATK